MLSRILLKPVVGKSAQAQHDVSTLFSAKHSAQTLTAEGLSISFGGVDAVADFGFTAQPGHITSIIGPNGAGKTTALNLIGGFYKPDRGVIRLGTRDVSRYSSHAVARAGIARTYQTTQLFEHMSVLDNVMIALRQGKLRVSQLFSPDDHENDLQLAESLLAFVGYSGSLHQLAGALPHIDKRLVEIARALALRPSVLLLDEPAAGLGREDTTQLSDLLVQIARQELTVILVEHDMSLVMAVSDHIVVLDAGKKIAAGLPKDIRNNPIVLKAYLGEKQDSGGWPRSDDSVITGDEVLKVEHLSAGYGACTCIARYSSEC